MMQVIGDVARYNDTSGCKPDGLGQQETEYNSYADGLG